MGVEVKHQMSIWTYVIVWIYLLNVINWSFGQQTTSTNMCRSLEYRFLPQNLKNEHQCILLEQLVQNTQADRDRREELMSKVLGQLESLSNKISQRIQKINSADQANRELKYSPSFTSVPLIRECNELNINGIHVSGVYPIKLPLGKIINVWCDMETDKGGWTVIQRRIDGSVNFTRSWNEYAFGFGNPNTEYWLGNEYIYQLTSYYNFTMRIDMTDWEGDRAYAEYEFFYLNNEEDGYRIYISGYTGTAGDSFRNYHNNMKFSTYDKDNDLWFSSCAKKDHSGWWYRNCGYCTLNGVYVENGIIPLAPDGIIRGVIWYDWKKRYSYSLKTVEIKIKPTLAIKSEREVLQDLVRTTSMTIQDVETTTQAGP